MIDNLSEIGLELLLDRVSKAQREGFRFITASCTRVSEGIHEITYHFDKNYEMQHLRISVKKEDVIPSISQIYSAAILIENEMKELFGVKIDGILVDYGGHFLLSDDALQTPFNRTQIIIEQKEGKKNG